MPIWLNRSPKPPTAQYQKSVLQTIKTKDAVCAVLARCDGREPKTVDQKAPQKVIRISRHATRDAASSMESAVRKGKTVSKVSIFKRVSTGSTSANIKVVTSHLSRAQGRRIVARSWVILTPHSALSPQRRSTRLQQQVTMLRSAHVKPSRSGAI
jgi:hypothetical protein